MIEIRGYKIKGASLVRLETVLKEARQAIQEATNAEYHRMLSAEITDMVDDATLGLIPRPAIPILSAAENSLQERITRSGLGFDTEYNLKASVAVLTDGKDTYLILYAKNAELISAFESSSKSGALINYSLVYDDRFASGLDRVETPESKKWEELKGLYGDNVSQTGMTAGLSAQMPRIDLDALSFPLVADRARDRARYDYTNRMLSQYTTGLEIQPHKLMRLTDQALSAAISEDGEAEIERMAIHLAGILPPITLELVKSDPNQQRQHQAPGFPSIKDVINASAPTDADEEDADTESASQDG